MKLCFVLLKLIYRVYNAISIKITNAFLSLSLFFFAEMDKLILKSIQNFKELRTDKIILEKKNKVGGLTRPNLKTYCKTIVAKTLWYWHKGRHRKQENRNEIPEIYKSLVDWNLTRMPKPFKGRNNSSFNNWCWDTWTSTCKRLKLDPYLTSHTKLIQNGSKT